MARCKTEGCGEKAKASYCQKCLERVRLCAVDDCLERISAHNRSGYCYDHRYIAMKVKMLSKMAGVALALWASTASADMDVGAAGAALDGATLSSRPVPCQRTSAGVLCDEESFGRLIGKCIGCEEEAGLCRERLARAESDLVRVDAARVAAEKALAECLSRPLPAPVRVGVWKAPVALTLGAVGAAALVSAVALPLSWEGRATAGVGGLALLGGGIWAAW
jgi:hypothetical protein